MGKVEPLSTVRLVRALGFAVGMLKVSGCLRLLCVIVMSIGASSVGSRTVLWACCWYL